MQRRWSLSEEPMRYETALWTEPIARALILTLAALSLVAVGPAQAQQPDEAVLEMVVELIQDPDKDMRALGLQQVREALPGAAVTKRLTELLPKLAPEPRTELLEALGERRDTAARPALLHWANSGKEPQVRAAALDALGHIGTADDVPLLAEKAAKGTGAEREAARSALSRMRAERAEAAMTKLLASAESAVQMALLDVLADRRATEAVPAVLACAKQRDPNVRIAAINSLRYLATAQHVSELVQLLAAAKSGYERWRTELALLNVCARHGQACAEPLVQAFKLANSVPTQLSLLHCLARVGGTQSLSIVAASAVDGPEPVRTEAVRMLAGWPDRAVVPTLRRLAALGNPLRHRVLALRALIRVSLNSASTDPEEKLVAEYLRVAGEARAEIEAVLRSELAQAPRPKLSTKLEPIPLKLPAPAFRGTPVPLKEPNIEKPLGKPRPPFLAPAGTTNLAAGRRVAASDSQPTTGELDFVVDGHKEASDFACLELHPGTQWVQIDLGRRAVIFAIVVWHNHAEARVYRDVIVQLSDDPDFIAAYTVFNNDHDDSSRLGTGKDKGYVETAEGKLIDCKGIEGRFVRLYSRGNHIDAKNHYTEVEVYGIPLE